MAEWMMIKRILKTSKSVQKLYALFRTDGICKEFAMEWDSRQQWMKKEHLQLLFWWNLFKDLYEAHLVWTNIIGT
jgi:hypothetical protein